jgi:hypothetical protein
MAKSSRTGKPRRVERIDPDMDPDMPPLPSDAAPRSLLAPRDRGARSGLLDPDRGSRAVASCAPVKFDALGNPVPQDR